MSVISMITMTKTIVSLFAAKGMIENKQ